MTLDELNDGARAVVTAVGGGSRLRRRLLELGMTHGTELTAAGRAPGGDPLSVRLRGALLTLRREDARQVELRPLRGQRE